MPTNICPTPQALVMHTTAFDTSPFLSILVTWHRQMTWHEKSWLYMVPVCPTHFLVLSMISPAGNIQKKNLFCLCFPAFLSGTLTFVLSRPAMQHANWYTSSSVSRPHAHRGSVDPVILVYTLPVGTGQVPDMITFYFVYYSIPCTNCC
jgi:hypothetical protein